MKFQGALLILISNFKMAPYFFRKKMNRLLGRFLKEEHIQANTNLVKLELLELEGRNIIGKKTDYYATGIFKSREKIIPGEAAELIDKLISSDKTIGIALGYEIDHTIFYGKCGGK